MDSEFFVLVGFIGTLLIFMFAVGGCCVNYFDLKDACMHYTTTNVEYVECLSGRLNDEDKEGRNTWRSIR